MLRLLPVPALADNYIWLLGNSTSAVIVDPGEAGPVKDMLARERLTPAAILLTHHHPDHINGTSALLVDFKIPVYAPVDSRIPFTTVPMRNGDQISVPALSTTFSIMEIPGHTLSHIAYHGAGILFCGDTLFSVGCGKLFEGTPAQMLSSLDRLSALPAETLVCCGHEYTVSNCEFALTVDPENMTLKQRYSHARKLRTQGHPTLPSTLAEERITNPFLRTDDPLLANWLDRSLGNDAGDRNARFALLRRLKDEFRTSA